MRWKPSMLREYNFLQFNVVFLQAGIVNNNNNRSIIFESFFTLLLPRHPLINQRLTRHLFCISFSHMRQRNGFTRVDQAITREKKTLFHILNLSLHFTFKGPTRILSKDQTTIVTRILRSSYAHFHTSQSSPTASCVALTSTVTRS